MLFKKTIAYIVAFFIVVGILFYINKKNIKSLDKKKAFLFDKTKVYKIVFKFNNKNKSLIQLEKNNNNWFLIKNKSQYLANAILIDNVLSSLYDLPELDRFNPKNSLDVYGLKKPKITINIFTKKQNFIYYIGDNTVRKDFYYLKIKSKNEIFLLPSIAISNIKDNTFYYREKKLIPLFKKENYKKIEISMDNFHKIFINKNNEWFCENIKLDNARINEFLITLGILKANNFLSLNNDNLEKFSFNPPKAILKLYYDKKNYETIKIGYYDKKEGYFIINNKKEIIKVIYPGLVNILKNNILFYKNRTLFSLESSNLDKITLFYKEKKAVYKYKNNKDEFEAIIPIPNKLPKFYNKRLREIVTAFMPFQTDEYYMKNNKINNKINAKIILNLKNGKQVDLEFLERYNKKYFIAKTNLSNDMLLIKPLLYKKLYILWN